jgi:hypothetical protein
MVKEKYHIGNTVLYYYYYAKKSLRVAEIIKLTYEGANERAAA